MSNPYYSPEKLGLSILAQNDIAGAYEFNMCVVWKHAASGRIFYAFDSGCSCPSPFENYFFTDDDGILNTDLNEATARNFEGAAQEMEAKHFEKGEMYKMLKKALAPNSGRV